MVRSWKRRYFVLQRSQLRYFETADPSPPFGKGLKGEIRLSGTLLLITNPFQNATSTKQLFGSLRKFNSTHVARPDGPLLYHMDICGQLGEKDLTVELDYSEVTQVTQSRYWA